MASVETGVFSDSDSSYLINANPKPSPAPSTGASHHLPPPHTSSPFPSPSSSFLPPPTPGAHEFAVRIPAGSRKGSVVAASRPVSTSNGVKQEERPTDQLKALHASQPSEILLLTPESLAAAAASLAAPPSGQNCDVKLNVEQEALLRDALGGGEIDEKNNKEGGVCVGKGAETAESTCTATSNGMGLSQSNEAVDRTDSNSHTPPSVSEQRQSTAATTPDALLLSAMTTTTSVSSTAPSSTFTPSPAPVQSTTQAAPNAQLSANPDADSITAMTTTSGAVSSPTSLPTSTSPPAPAPTVQSTIETTPDTQSLPANRDANGVAAMTTEGAAVSSPTTLSTSTSSPAPAPSRPLKRHSQLLTHSVSLSQSQSQVYDASPRPRRTASTSSSSSRPPSTYLADLSSSLSSSRPAPPSPALAATASPILNLKRLSVASGGDGGGGGGGGRRSRPPSGTFTLTRSTSTRDSKRMSSQLSAFVLPSPLASPSCFSAVSNSGGVFARMQGDDAERRRKGVEEEEEEPRTPVAGSGVGEPFTLAPPSSAASVMSGISEVSTVGPGSPRGDAETTTTTTNIPVTSTTPAPTISTTAEVDVTTKTKPVVWIKIRDFAFEKGDERHVGRGPHVPRCVRAGRLEWKLGRVFRQQQQPASTGAEKPQPTSAAESARASWDSSSSSTTSGEEEEEEDDDDGGWASFRNGFGRLSWTNPDGPGAGGAAAAAAGSSGYYPSRSEMDRNFLDDSGDGDDEGEENDEAKPYDYSRYEEPADFEYGSSGYRGVADDYDGGGGGGAAAGYDSQRDEDDEEDDYEEEPPLLPGMYRALYAFEPEGTAEVRLVEDEIVRVVGRGGGPGWAVVVVVDTLGGSVDAEEDGAGVVGGKVKHGLVPESYLELVRADEDDDDHEEAQ